MSVHAPRGVALQFNARQQAVQQERIRQGAVSGQPSEVHDHTDNANGINSSQFNYPQANQNVQQEDKNIFQQFGDWCKDVWEKSNPFFKVVEVALIAFVSVLAIRYTSMGIRAAVGAIGGKFAANQAGQISHLFGDQKLQQSKDKVLGHVDKTKKALEEYSEAHGQVLDGQHHERTGSADLSGENITLNNWLQNLFYKGKCLIVGEKAEIKEMRERKQNGKALQKTGSENKAEASARLNKAIANQHLERSKYASSLLNVAVKNQEEKVNELAQNMHECRTAINSVSSNQERKRNGLKARLISLKKVHEKEIELLNSMKIQSRNWDRENSRVIPTSTIRNDSSGVPIGINEEGFILDNHSTLPLSDFVKEVAQYHGTDHPFVQECFAIMHPEDVRDIEHSLQSHKPYIQVAKESTQKIGKEPFWGWLADLLGYKSHLRPLSLVSA